MKSNYLNQPVTQSNPKDILEHVLLMMQAKVKKENTEEKFINHFKILLSTKPCEVMSLTMPEPCGMKTV